MKIGVLFIFLLLISKSHGQTGGNFSFPFLGLDYNARTAATGGYFVALADDDVNQGLANPSLINNQMSKSISVSQAFLAGGVNYGMVAYANKIWKGVFTSNVRYVDYGEFQRTEPNGELSGVFRPFEYAVGFGYGQFINPVLSIGGNFNLIGSNLETYSAYGASIDLAGSFHHPNKLFTASVCVKNAGIKFKSFSQNDRGIFPVDFQLAAAYKLAHAPFRFNLVLHDLNRWDLTYNDPFAMPTYDALTGDTIPVPKANFVEKLARHVLISSELLLSKSFTLRMGFNYHRRQEMKLVERPGISGLSFGLGFKSSLFRIDYGFVFYSKAGNNHVISLSSSIDKWKKK
jgi:hypothetical protein